MIAEDTCSGCGERWDRCSCVPDLDDDDYEDRRCRTCGGDGFVFGDEMGDPMWYDPGEAYACPNCGGTGNAKDQTYW